MKLVYVDQTDSERFNQFIERHPRGHPLQTWNWGEVKAQTGWTPFRMAVEDGGEYIAAASILRRQVPWTNRGILYAPRGPVVDWGNDGLVSFLLGGIRKVAEQERAILLKIDPDLLADEAEQVQGLQGKGFRRIKAGPNFEGVQPRFVMRLDLRDRSEDELLAAFHSKTRYNIRYAFRKGVKVKRDCSFDDLQRFYDILEVTARRDGFVIRSREYFVQLWKHMVKGGFARLMMAEWEDKPLAGALGFRAGNRVWYVYGASTNEHRNLMAPYAVQWEFIRWARELGCDTYDFRGVSGDLDPDNPLYGLYRFKKGFDATLFELAGEFDHAYHRGWYWAWTALEPMYRRLRARLSSLG